MELPFLASYCIIENGVRHYFPHHPMAKHYWEKAKAKISKGGRLFNVMPTWNMPGYVDILFEHDQLPRWEGESAPGMYMIRIKEKDLQDGEENKS